jgi:plasmid stabilization system protein ParE
MKTKLYRLIAEARIEFDGQYDNLLLHSVPKANRFRAEIEKGFQAIVAKPNGFGYVAGSPYRSYGPTKKEKYGIAYLETDDEIIIVAVFYSGSPDPLYWIERAF